jgi:hypothetical protein
MKRALAFFIVVLVLELSPQPARADLPSSIQAEYDVIGFGMTLANITETFTRDGDNYRIESITKAVGLLARFKPETVRVSSQGKITPSGLQPLAFSMTRELDTGKNASAKFNWEKSIVTQTDYKGVNDYPLPKGTQDRLSLLYHLPLLLRTEHPDLKFSITDGNNIEAYSFAVLPETQKIRVPLGAFSTRLITNIPIGDEMKYEIWLTDDQNAFPCKIIVTDTGGGKLTQVLTALTVTP